MKTVCILVVLLAAPIAGSAQEPSCSEKTIRDAVQNRTIKYTDDNFFWSGAFDKPLIGSAQREESGKKLEAEEPRKNEVSAEHPQRIVVSKSGDMAYEYGTGELSYDEQKTGKHTSFQTGYLRVWKLVDGHCRVAATMIKPIESTIKSN